MLTVTSEDVCRSIQNVNFDIIKVSYTMRQCLLFLMFVTAVCVLFLLKLRWPKPRAIIR